MSGETGREIKEGGPAGGTESHLRTVYTDGVHLMCADEEALHAFARRIGLKPEWYQQDGNRPHYDLTTARAAGRAVDAGAVAVGSSKDLIRLIDREARIMELEAQLKNYNSGDVTPTSDCCNAPVDVIKKEDVVSVVFKCTSCGSQARLGGTRQ